MPENRVGTAPAGGLVGNALGTPVLGLRYVNPTDTSTGDGTYAIAQFDPQGNLRVVMPGADKEGAQVVAVPDVRNLLALMLQRLDMILGAILSQKEPLGTQPGFDLAGTVTERQRETFTQN